MACRDIIKAKQKAKEIISQTHNNNIEVEKLDLADLESVREFANKINKKLTRLDLLVNNAGLNFMIQ